LALLAGVSLMGCIGPGMLTDGSSVSSGSHSRGVLRHPSALPFRGLGYDMPPTWRARQRNFGTDELVRLLERVALRVRREKPGGVLGVADLSPLGGGQTPQHHSHHSGRDVDLIPYATDLKGKPLPPVAMVHFDGDGMSVPPTASAPSSTPTSKTAPKTNEPVAEKMKSESSPASAPAGPPLHPRRFDVARNWALIKALVTDPEIPVQWIFIGRKLNKLLIRYARRKREPPTLIIRALRVMRQPGDASPHTDHFHVRIFCAPSDRGLGCDDRGPSRWFKKTIKYRDAPPHPQPLGDLAAWPSGLSYPL
ncbi:MAG: penicillin-insensitive murein endopeptidase, partial [Deltaproteobacteria bacterium]|nr:penicillin-insensitive murein endopeptidase [Deltaproteobacteria bacterium]